MIEISSNELNDDDDDDESDIEDDLSENDDDDDENNSDGTSDDEHNDHKQDQTQLNHHGTFPFTRLKYVVFDGYGDDLMVPLLRKLMNKHEIEYICLNCYLCTEILQTLVSEFPNLKTLEVSNVFGLANINMTNKSVTSFIVNDENDSGVSLDYDDLLRDVLQVIAECFPNLERIEFECRDFFMDVVQLLRLLISPAFKSLKKLKVHVVNFFAENDDDFFNMDEWNKFSELKQLPELELSCEFTNMAILLMTPFKPKSSRIHVRLVSSSYGYYCKSMKDLIGNSFNTSKNHRRTMWRSVGEWREEFLKQISYDNDYENPEE